MLGDLLQNTSSQADVNADEYYMELAISAARTAMGRVAPNPAVGAVVVNNGNIVAVGATQPPPGQHAEIVALNKAGAQSAGSHLYVTLEPCCHFGNTPPCTAAIIDAGIKRVIIGTIDPNPRVHNKGIDQLRSAGIEVESGCLEPVARKLIAGFRTRLERHRPHVLAKYAMTLDGKIATHTGHSRWISGTQARALTHIIRDRIDGIVVGSNTVVVDNPRLTTRISCEQAGYGGPHDPQRIIIDGGLRTPPEADILTTESTQQTVIYCRDDASDELERRLTDAGAVVRRIPVRNEHVDLQAVFEDLGERGMNQVLVEGGGGLIGALFDRKLVDELLAFIAPVIVGGNGPPPVAGEGVATMPEAWRLDNQRMRLLDGEIMLNGQIHYPDNADV